MEVFNFGYTGCTSLSQFVRQINSSDSLETFWEFHESSLETETHPLWRSEGERTKVQRQQNRTLEHLERTKRENSSLRKATLYEIQVKSHDHFYFFAQNLFTFPPTYSSPSSHPLSPHNTPTSGVVFIFPACDGQILAPILFRRSLFFLTLIPIFTSASNFS